MSAYNKFQPIQSSRLTGQSEHILDLLYRLQGIRLILKT